MTFAPVMTPSLNRISMYFPNLELLSFFNVLAFPKLSSRGEVSKICSVIRLETDLFTAARYWKTKTMIHIT